MGAAVAVDGLVKRYGSRPVVDGVSLEVAEGGVLALLGPNGAGKTTTVECVAGLRRPDAGDVRLLGCDPVRERDRVVGRLGMMLQEGGVHRAATPRELVGLFAALYPAPADPARLMRRLGIDRLADRKVRSLSIGERQRVSLAMALVGQPRVAILDEPTAAMDPAGRRVVWDLVDELRGDGVAVLLTTHSMEEAERLADTVAVLDGGRLLALDTPLALTGDTSRGLVLTSRAAFDATALAAALGVDVRPEGPGRWVVDAGAERIPEVTAWFADQGLPLEGISSATRSLEDVYLRLTEGGGER